MPKNSFLYGYSCNIYLKSLNLLARSGKSNIVEGRTDATVSCEMEIKLYGVAIGSLEELLNDYEDYMRIHDIPFGIRPIPDILN